MLAWEIIQQVEGKAENAMLNAGVKTEEGKMPA
jgi:hypothetical protein